LSALERPDGGLYRTWRAGKARLHGYLEDYAFLADALVSLYEAAGWVADASDPGEFLLAAQTLAERMLRDFAAEDGAFYATAHQHEALIVRHREGHDGAIPNANAVAAGALFRIARHMDRAEWRDLAIRALEAHGATMQRAPRAFAASWLALERCRERPVEVVAVGKPGSPELTALLAEVARAFLPDATFAMRWPGHWSSLDTPLLRGKELVAGAPALYVCRNFECLRPITDAAQVLQALGALAQDAGAGGDV
jgi:uncharacterized protein